MTKKTWILVMIGLIGCVSAASSQNYSFTATASPKVVSQGNTLQVSFTIENANASNFKAPTFPGFDIAMGPSQSQQTSIINGRRSSSVSINYVLVAKQKGTFTIMPASVTINGQIVKSNSLTIQVVEPSQAEKMARAEENQAEKDLNSKAMGYIKNKLFLRLSTSKKDVYQGEQIVAEYRLFIHRDLERSVSQTSTPKVPILSGFFSEEVEVKDPVPSTEVINGEPYRCILIKKVILMPQKSGKLTIDPLKMDFKVRVSVNAPKQKKKKKSNSPFFDDPFEDFFDDPFFSRNSYRDFEYTASSGSETINVRPLPANPPVSFNGAVGKFELIANLNKTNTRTNEPVTLKLKISGSGNLKLIEPLDLKIPPDIESFEPKTIDDISMSTNGISGSKSFEYLLIPRYPGSYTIGPIEFTYFDLDRKQYVTVKSAAFNLIVTKGEGAVVRANGNGGEELKVIGEDIRFIKTGDSDFNKSGDSFFGSWLFYLMSISPALFFAFVFVYWRKRRDLYENEALMKSRRAEKIARQRLNLAKNHLDAGNKPQFFEELSKATWGYISDKLHIPVSELTRDNASASLKNMNIDVAVIANLMDIIDKCEYARFAPSGDENIAMGKVFEDSVTVLSGIEEKLKQG